MILLMKLLLNIIVDFVKISFVLMILKLNGFMNIKILKKKKNLKEVALYVGIIYNNILKNYNKQ